MTDFVIDPHDPRLDCYKTETSAQIELLDKIKAKLASTCNQIKIIVGDVEAIILDLNFDTELFSLYVICTTKIGTVKLFDFHRFSIASETQNDKIIYKILNFNTVEVLAEIILPFATNSFELDQRIAKRIAVLKQKIKEHGQVTKVVILDNEQVYTVATVNFDPKLKILAISTTTGESFQFIAFGLDTNKNENNDVQEYIRDLGTVKLLATLVFEGQKHFF